MLSVLIFYSSHVQLTVSRWHRQVSWTDEEEQEFYRFHEESFYASNVRDLTGLSDKALFRQKGQSKVLPGSPGGLAGDCKIMEGDWFFVNPSVFLMDYSPMDY